MRAKTRDSDTVSNNWDLTHFESLYKELSANLQKYADYLLRDQELAFTVVNDLFVSLWFNPRKPENMKAYLYKSVKNLAINHIKKNGNTLISYLNPPDLTQLAELHPESANENDSEKLVFLQQVINMLPEKRQLVFRMYRLEGLSYLEIANLLEISPRTVEDHLSKSMQFIHSQAKHLVDK